MSPQPKDQYERSRRGVRRTVWIAATIAVLLFVMIILKGVLG